MKDNHVSAYKIQIPKIEKGESSRVPFRNSKTPTIDSIIKGSKSVQNVLDSNVLNISQQCLNNQLNTSQLMKIPIPVRMKNDYLKKQSVFSFDVISSNKKTFLQENIDLKEHIKFLLKQIKKLNQSKSFGSNYFYNELFSKLTHEIEVIKGQLKEKEERMDKFKNDYDNCSKENKELKELLFKRKDYSFGYLVLENKENIEYVNYKKEVGINNITATTISVNNEDSNNMTNLLSYSAINPNMSSSIPYYIKKVGIGAPKKKESVALSCTTASTVMHAIVEKKLVLSKSFNSLCFFKEKYQMNMYDITNNQFSNVEYEDTCHFNKCTINEQDLVSLNVSNGLYILTGDECNQFYFYDINTNLMTQLRESLYSHPKGSLIAYTNYFSEKSLICLSGKNNTKVEIYCVNSGKWSELPEIDNDNISSRIDTGYILINNHYLIALFGYDYVNDNYIESIDLLSLSNPLKWEQIALESQTNRLCYKLLLRSHTAFKTKNETNNNSQIIYLLGGYNAQRTNNSLIEIDIKTDLSKYSLIINDQQNEKEAVSYTFSSLLYNYSGQPPNKKNIKYGFDDNGDIHIIDTELMKHNIVINSEIKI